MIIPRNIQCTLIAHILPFKGSYDGLGYRRGILGV